MDKINNLIDTQKDTLSLKKIIVGSTLTASTIVGIFCALRYRTSLSNQWLVRTGMFIKDMEIKKKCVQLPFQEVETINLSPETVKFSISSMSKEKMEFNFPAVFTIGPKNDNDSLQKYARFMLNQDGDSRFTVISGIIEGEARSVAANLPIEEIFYGRNLFKNEILDGIQTQLDQYGLHIYNANIEELKDSESSNYFKMLSQKIQSTAENQAKVDVAEQNKIGEIGSKEREGTTRQRTAEIEAQTRVLENTRQQEILKSQAELEKLRAEQKFIIEQAKIKSEGEADALKMEMEKIVEAKRLETETERERAEELSKIRVKAEIDVKNAEAQAQAKKILADADYFQKQREAEGILAMYNAQAEGFNKIVNSFNGDTNALINYMMMDKGIYLQLAEQSAKAIQGLNPKITVWNTGKEGNPYDSIKDLGKTLIPMLDTIQNQTGYKLPEWMIQKEKSE
jgi:flotillin